GGGGGGSSISLAGGQLLRKDPALCLVLDCRPYLSYSASCLRGSLNVNLNSVVIRRSHGRPVPLHFVVPDETARGRLLEDGDAAPPRTWTAVVVLDQNTRHWRKLKKESTAQIVLNTLSASLPEAGARGYETFYSQYPEFCIDAKPLKSIMIYSSFIFQGGPVEILPFLYLGSAYHASKCEFLANLNITALLNVSRKSSEPFTNQFCYKWIPVEDSHTADISSHFQEAIEFIDCTRRAGGKILVHCEAGISRSPTICMAYLMKTRKFRLEEAFDYIKQRRSLISPNFSFMGQLLQYESEILSLWQKLECLPFFLSFVGSKKCHNLLYVSELESWKNKCLSLCTNQPPLFCWCITQFKVKIT
uniref:protein-tyrosine-phosphatase n=1 Tax=Laticauda laticaudata TaxID=8630 RepID=A0A8C5RU54_LATLA